MNDHAEQENIVIEHSNPYHIIRPVVLKDGASIGDKMMDFYQVILCEELMLLYI